MKAPNTSPSRKGIAEMAGKLALRVEAPDAGAAFDRATRELHLKLERALLVATDRAGRRAKANIRAEMSAAGLGRLGQAIDVGTDLESGRGVHRNGRGFSASAIVHARTRSPRTVGALLAYTEGATIRPRRGRWLWIPSDEIQRVVGSRATRERVTPESYQRMGLESRIGPLVQIRGINGRPLLVVERASVSEAGKRRSAKSRTKTGRLRKGQRAKQFIVAFVAIPSTSRAARVDINAIMARAAAELPAFVELALGGR